MAGVGYPNTADMTSGTATEVVAWPREVAEGEHFDIRHAASLAAVFGVSAICWIAIGVALFRIFG